MRNNKAGFTLLEILIALFIFSIVSMIMVTALHTVFNSQSITAKHAAALTKLQIAFLLMSHDFEQTVNRPVTNAKGIVDPPFIGTHDTVTFTHGGVANPLGMMQRSTLQRTAYSLNNDRLIRSIWPVLDQTQKTLPSHRVLLRSTTELRFDYLDNQGKFQNNWPPADQKQSAFPRAVRVIITLKNWGTLSQLYIIPQTEKPPEKAPSGQTPGQPSAQPAGQMPGQPSMQAPSGQPSSANFTQ
jgi:general secretion pathway protein J